MAKKLLLINPVNPQRVGLTVNRSSCFPPLGLGIIAALTPSDWEVKIVDENFEQFTFEDADLVGLTAFTASVNRAYEIARIYRERGIPTVLGGVHASILPQEALHYVDSVVIGEAEGVWSKIIAEFCTGKMERMYRGGHSPMDAIPVARHDLFHTQYMFGSIQTARGCPMDCDFCTVPIFSGKRYRARPVEVVLDELERIPHKMVFFVDDNIIGYGRNAMERAIQLFRGIIRRGIKKEWFCQASLNFADSDVVLEYAAESGCRMVFLGVEAERMDALRDANKKLNMRIGIEGYRNAFRRINHHGIAVLGAFIYGLERDTVSSLRQRTNYILGSGVDVMQMTYLTPLPGTRLFERLNNEKRLFYTNFPDDWEHYDMTEVIHKPTLMSADELMTAMHKANRKLYNRCTLLRKFLKTWFSTRSFITSMWAYSSNYNYRNVALSSTGG
jgi:radical SAM superfamily enzyme YgiQ (UPF0313 family)